MKLGLTLGLQLLIESYVHAVFESIAFTGGQLVHFHSRVIVHFTLSLSLLILT